MATEIKKARMGIDVGSTTLKIIILDSEDKIVWKSYKRHQANISQTLTNELLLINQEHPYTSYNICITGSAGLGVAERCKIPFIQEVVASVTAVEKLHPNTHTLIDLGGEDAKMVFFEKGKQPDIRMNGNCAGGTGAFIDQMANLMNITVEELGVQALSYENIYPVASRCGVFAKTDIQNLICRNIPIADISASVLHTVALQAITALARGADILPEVLCIGGPLTFIPALRNAFLRILGLQDADMIVPENGAYFPAWGCALSASQEEESQQHLLANLADSISNEVQTSNDTLPTLFGNEKEYDSWKQERKIVHLEKEETLPGHSYECFLGIDSGSTTTKVVIINTNGKLIYNFYEANEGNPLKKAVEGLEAFIKYTEDNNINFRFLASAVTGYGEDLIRSALNLDYGIVETMAHLSGAQFVDPEVSFILDIGGQDIKSLFVHNGIISNIELNEACSSGCGSFLQNFAASMNLSLNEFSDAACRSKAPCNLGSRCTVFMNSKVKQALRENAEVGDIAAGLSYSVVKNCLFKVLKISNLNQLGEHIVVQGGTFKNKAVYRIMEMLSGKSISSTDHPELMGALGAALYAQKRWNKEPRTTSFTGKEGFTHLTQMKTKELNCKGCSNKCAVLRFQFENGNVSFAGNKCEKVFYNRNNTEKKGYNALEWKNELLFENSPAKPVKPTLRIGIPRVLNMFDNFPFWQTLFNECGIEVVLSPESTFGLYQKGVGSIMSENICFPAKLVHGHILALVEQKVDRIFYPIITTEEKEFTHSVNSFNCPVVSGYPDVIRSAIDPESKYGIAYDKPTVTFANPTAAKRACMNYLSTLGISKETIEKAYDKAIKKRAEVKSTLADQQKALMNEAINRKEPVFIIAGRPYHVDPLVNQKVGQILTDLGAHVFTDDVFRTTANKGFGKLNIVSQWSYPNRIVQAAMEVAKLPPHVQYIQLNSFGCGPDSFYMDEVTEILKQAGKNHTVLRIDEIASPGSIRLRLRSLIESLKAAEYKPQTSDSH